MGVWMCVLCLPLNPLPLTSRPYPPLTLHPHSSSHHTHSPPLSLTTSSPPPLLTPTPPLLLLPLPLPHSPSHSPLHPPLTPTSHNPHPQGELPPELNRVAFSNQRASSFIEACLQHRDKRPSATELLAEDFLKPNEVRYGIFMISFVLLLFCRWIGVFGYDIICYWVVSTALIDAVGVSSINQLYVHLF